jgi:hypothetical protein
VTTDKPEEAVSHQPSAISFWNQSVRFLLIAES